MYELLLVLIVVMFLLVKTREHFGLVVWTKNDWFTTDTDTTEGYEIFSTFPNSCPPDKSDKDGGLCYRPCRAGFHGVGPVCWADSESVGVGRPIGLEPCPAGWKNDGLICREPIYNDCSWKGLFGECWGRLRGGRLKGRLDGGGICDWPADRGNLPNWLVDKSKKEWVATHPDKVAGLCYKKCPNHLPVRIPGMPYLCYKGGPLSYGRGVGIIPSMARVGRTYTFF
jgi:hypothetical protein